VDVVAWLALEAAELVCSCLRADSHAAVIRGNRAILCNCQGQHFCAAELRVAGNDGVAVHVPVQPVRKIKKKIFFCKKRLKLSFRRLLSTVLQGAKVGVLGGYLADC
jgi:hypothetical protein